MTLIAFVCWAIVVVATVACVISLLIALFAESGEAFKFALLCAVVASGTMWLGGIGFFSKHGNAEEVAVQRAVESDRPASEVSTPSAETPQLAKTKLQELKLNPYWGSVFLALAGLVFMVYLIANKDFEYLVLVGVMIGIALHVGGAVRLIEPWQGAYNLTASVAWFVLLLMVGFTVLVVTEHPHYAAGLTLAALVIGTLTGAIHPLNFAKESPFLFYGLIGGYFVGLLPVGWYHWHRRVEPAAASARKRREEFLKLHRLPERSKIPAKLVPAFVTFVEENGIHHDVPQYSEEYMYVWDRALYWPFRAINRLFVDLIPEGAKLLLSVSAPIWNRLTTSRSTMLEEADPGNDGGSGGATAVDTAPQGPSKSGPADGRQPKTVPPVK